MRKSNWESSPHGFRSENSKNIWVATTGPFISKKVDVSTETFLKQLTLNKWLHPPNSFFSGRTDAFLMRSRHGSGQIFNGLFPCGLLFHSPKMPANHVKASEVVVLCVLIGCLPWGFPRLPTIRPKTNGWGRGPCSTMLLVRKSGYFQNGYCNLLEKMSMYTWK